MKIQYFSDIHLEFGELPPPSVNADVIVAAGDIGIGLQGLEWLADLDVPVIYVAGNHEFYEHDLDRLLDDLATRAAALGIHFLENGSVTIDGVRFLGTTLWTDFGDGEAEIYTRAREFMNDFYMIIRGTSALSPEDVCEINLQSRRWLETQLAEPSVSEPTVVVTHHAPSHLSWDDTKEMIYRPAYCNTLDSIIAENDIRLWIHGHVHSATDYTINGTRVVCNPHGYRGLRTVPDFDFARRVEI